MSDAVTSSVALLLFRLWRVADRTQDASSRRADDGEALEIRADRAGGRIAISRTADELQRMLKATSDLDVTVVYATSLEPFDVADPTVLPNESMSASTWTLVGHRRR